MTILETFIKLRDDLRLWVTNNLSMKPGKKTTDGGEIFNDYENNQAAAEYAHAEGLKTKVYGTGGHAEGHNTTAGVLGYYFYNIDTTNNKIYLSDTFCSAPASPVNVNYTRGDSLTIIYKKTKYVRYTYVTAVDGNVLTVNSLPMQEFCLPDAEDIATGSKDDYYLYVQTKPAAGIIPFEYYSHAEGIDTIALGNAAHAEGNNTRATGHNSHAEGHSAEALGDNSHAEGNMTCVEGSCSHVEGSHNKAIGGTSHAEGFFTIAEGDDSHTEGQQTKATGHASHAEGLVTIAKGEASHTEGYRTTASSEAAHSEGKNNISGIACFEMTQNIELTSSSNNLYKLFLSNLNIDFKMNDTAYIAYDNKYYSCKYWNIQDTYITIRTEEPITISANFDTLERKHLLILNKPTVGDSFIGMAAHSEGSDTHAIEDYSHTSGLGTIAIGKAQTVMGQYNTVNTDALFVIGNGESASARSNAFTVEKNGDVKVSGNIETPNNIYSNGFLTDYFQADCQASFNGSASFYDDVTIDSDLEISGIATVGSTVADNELSVVNVEYLNAQLNALITVADIDTICGSNIVAASEVTF